jgi:peptidoglycan hydrolase-like protein with peptidoglycan-binding domain
MKASVSSGSGTTRRTIRSPPPISLRESAGGAQRLNRGDAPPILPADEMLALQERLNALGYDAGDPDGRLGEKTRAGVKQAQLALDLPPDGYPTRELVERLGR